MNEQVIVQRDPHEPLKTDKREKTGHSTQSLLQHLYQALLFWQAGSYPDIRYYP